MRAAADELPPPPPSPLHFHRFSADKLNSAAADNCLTDTVCGNCRGSCALVCSAICPPPPSVCLRFCCSSTANHHFQCLLAACRLRGGNLSFNRLSSQFPCLKKKKAATRVTKKSSTEALVETGESRQTSFSHSDTDWWHDNQDGRAANMTNGNKCGHTTALPVPCSKHC